MLTRCGLVPVHETVDMDKLTVYSTVVASSEEHNSAWHHWVDQHVCNLNLHDYLTTQRYFAQIRIGGVKYTHTLVPNIPLL